MLHQWNASSQGPDHLGFGTLAHLHTELLLSLHLFLHACPSLQFQKSSIVLLHKPLPLPQVLKFLEQLLLEIRGIFFPLRCFNILGQHLKFSFPCLLDCCILSNQNAASDFISATIDLILRGLT